MILTRSQYPQGHDDKSIHGTKPSKGEREQGCANTAGDVQVRMWFCHWLFNA